MNGKVVRLVRGDPSNMIVYSDDPIQIALEWERANVDGLHVIDLDATLGLGNNFQIIKQISKSINLPLQIGGGIHGLMDVGKAFDIGVDRVIVGTALFTGEIDVSRLLEYGQDRIVVALDHSDGWIVVNGWKKKLKLEVYPALQKFWDQGFRLFLSTNISRDGTLIGFNAAPLKTYGKFLNNVYIAGGIASLEDLRVLKRCKVRGAILGRVLYDKVIRVEEALEVAHNGSR